MARGLAFDYCLAATARDLDRAPSERRWDRGTTLSLDSGGTKLGYIGDLARMAVMGPPTAEMRELLEEVDSVQMIARRSIKPGALGAEVYGSTRAMLDHLPHHDQIEFEAHGIGLVSHEVPHLTGHAWWPYPGTHANRPLESGMVLSIETTIKNSDVGFVKLEDTLAVTNSGWDAYGDTARGWTVVEG